MTPTTQKEVEEVLLVVFAALFRAAGLARASDFTSTEQQRDSLAIEQAKDFVQACKEHKIWEPTQEG